MTLSKNAAELPPEQEAIRAKCFHPTGTFVEFPEEELGRSIPDRFERIVERFSDRIAVKSEQGELTYDALNRKANRLARAIVARCGAARKPVALFVKDATQFVAAHLAVLKAGKISLNLDVSAIQARIAHLLEDSQAAAIIVDGETARLARMHLNGAQRIIDMDEVSYAGGAENLRLPIAADDYCYLRYTSGTTGGAKAGVKTHRHVLHTVMNATNTFRICAHDRSVLLTRDSCLGKYGLEILLNGAALCPFFIANRTLSELAGWIAEQEITLYYSFPSALRHLLSTLPDEQAFPRVRLVRVEGEPIYKRDVELIRQHFGSECLLANSFSSTESGPVCLYFLDKDTPLNGAMTPVGYPVEGVAVSIVDESGRELGSNEPGEVVVRSRFLSAGYWRRPELTEQKFLGGRSAGERLYATGDIGRLSQDGCLQLLGRKDFQIKIRSFRVDTAIVESELALYPDIREVAVIGRRDSSDETTLVAYFVGRAPIPPSASELRGFLAQRLPDYMIPSAFVRLGNLPLSPTGKLDRRALPKPGGVRPSLKTPYAPPRNTIEAQIAEIWTQLLSLDSVGVLDNFFDLGGHSLSHSAMISRLLSELRIQTPPQTLLECFTIAAIAARIAEHRAADLHGREIAQIVDEVSLLSEDDAARLLANKPNEVKGHDS